MDYILVDKSLQRLSEIKITAKGKKELLNDL
jgi:hypothetical protein